eukprot:scaffold13796_cov39-Phaeocystis_antarctica.AAC.2
MCSSSQSRVRTHAVPLPKEGASRPYMCGGSLGSAGQRCIAPRPRRLGWSYLWDHADLVPGGGRGGRPSKGNNTLVLGVHGCLETPKAKQSSAHRFGVTTNVSSVRRV